MKKRLLSLVALAIFAFSVVGCAPEITVNTGGEGKKENISQSDKTAISGETTAQDETTSSNKTQTASSDKPETASSNNETVQSGDTDSGTNSSGAASSSLDAETLSRKEALAVAFAHAGVKESELRDIEAELDREGGKTVWEITFEKGKYEYDYVIDSESGEVLFHKKETDGTSSSAQTTSTQATISKNDALKKAFAHAGVKENELRDIEAELDRENGKALWEISFSKGRQEYEYAIDAKNGTVIKHKTEADD